MLAERSLRRQVSPNSLERGESYYARGHVTEFIQIDDVTFEITVRGRRRYEVMLYVRGDRLLVNCECPAFQADGTDCKHVWAAILATSRRSLLPERELALGGADAYGAPFSAERARPVTRRPRALWQQFLEALGPANETSPLGPMRMIPEEIVYVIARLAHSKFLTLQIFGRSRRKNGQWSKWRAQKFETSDLPFLPQFDRENVALFGHHYSNLHSVVLAPAVSNWWIERLARAGKLGVFQDDDVLTPIVWDDGPPWRFHVAIENDAAEATYRIVGSIERQGEESSETLPLDSVDAVIAETLIANGRAARFEGGNHVVWLDALRANGPIPVPHDQTEAFRQALVRVPITNITLPPELGWTISNAAPQPLLSLQHDAWSAELHGDVYFLYDEWRVAARSSETQTTIENKLIRRDRSAEKKYLEALSAVGAIASWAGYRIRGAALEDVAQNLTAQGWRLEMDSAPVHVADDVDVEISSGIDWFDVHVHAAFGDVHVALPELLAAAEARRSMLRLPDGSYGIVPASWAESLAPVLEIGKREGDVLRFRPAQALLIDSLLRSKAAVADQAFIDLRQRISSATPEPRHEPPTLAAELRPYQRAGLGWLHFLRDAGIGGCLADDMGLGKTVQTLALLEGIRASGITRPSLVVAPRSLLFNWAAEARRFAPRLRVVEHHGSGRAVNLLGEADLVLTTYATMRLDIADFSAIDFEYVVLDEAQAIKNASSQVAKATRLLQARHRLALSGTPIENHLGELWSLFEFLNPGLLGSARSFARTFAGKTTPPERREALSRALRPLILRRTKQQVAPELPDRTEQTLYCELEGKQRKQYDELRDHYRAALLGKVRKSGIGSSRMQILEALLRLRQAACDPQLIDPASSDPGAKLELLMTELRDVLESGHRALVFSQFTSFLAIVRKELDREGIDYLYLDGKTGDRQSLVEEFQSSDGPPVFLISLKAGGLGLNLTNADYIFLLDPWWNPAVEAQAIDRAHRIGRVRPVVAYRLIARDTVEEKILELQARKRELAESIISADNSVLRKLEVEDLELLLA